MADRLSRLSRLSSLDTLRGLIIVFMAIDHARGFIARNHPGEFWGAPLPDYHGDWVAFLTRLVTHLCAPGFMFLMGAGAALFAASRTREGWSPWRITGHLALRGIVLIVMGQLFESTAAAYGTAGAIRGETYGLRVPGAPAPISVILGVLYGLGSSLAIAAFFVRLPAAAIAVMAAACVAVTHWLTPDASQIAAPITAVMGALVVAGLAPPFVSVYPTIPWLAPTLLGVAFGRLLQHDRDGDRNGDGDGEGTRTRAFTLIGATGAAFVVLFLILRLTGGIGSFQPVQPGLMGLLNVTKYPPSLTFLLLTLGVNFMLLALFQRTGAGDARWTAPIRVFGAAPLFFFVTHLFLYGFIGKWYLGGATFPVMYMWWFVGLIVLYLPVQMVRRVQAAAAAELALEDAVARFVSSIDAISAPRTPTSAKAPRPAQRAARTRRARCRRRSAGTDARPSRT